VTQAFAKEGSACMIQRVNPPEVWSPFGAFSMAVVQGEGQVVHLKGQVALDREGRVVGREDMRAQTQKALENIRTVLGAMAAAPKMCPRSLIT
jgi:2-iminobutanoate/2-iminopropanoate deaminase